MPTNLNALIRYKQIDACLKNPYKNCTISYLQEVCTQSMGEKRGVYKLVSDRTIRDDIRILRSDILGFNAPIVFEDGRYFYSEPNYTIFSIPLTEKELLKDVLTMLLEERKNIVDGEVDQLLVRIANIIGEAVPLELTTKSEKRPIIKKSNYTKKVDKTDSASDAKILFSFAPSESENNIVNEKSSSYHRYMPHHKDLTQLELDWGDILLLLN